MVGNDWANCRQKIGISRAAQVPELSKVQPPDEPPISDWPNAEILQNLTDRQSVGGEPGLNQSALNLCLPRGEPTMKRPQFSLLKLIVVANLLGMGMAVYLTPARIAVKA